MLPLYSDHLVSGRTGLRTVGLARPSLPAPGLRGVAFHVLSSAEAAVGAGFDLERIGLRAVRGSPCYGLRNLLVKVEHANGHPLEWQLASLHGSFATESGSCEHVRFSPDINQTVDVPDRQLRANFGLMHCNKQSDYSITW
jgi:hypothetical protein